MKAINEPVYIDKSVYTDQIEKYKQRVVTLPGVRSLYLMGSINAPGLSDIDVIVVVDDDFSRELSNELSVSGLDNRIFLHGPIVVPKSLAENFQYIFYASNLKCLFGEKILQDWDDLLADQKKFLSVCYLIDFIESRFMQFSALNEDYINKRAWLTRIWSTVHSLFLYQFVSETPVPKSILKLADIVKLTRKQWLKNQVVEDDVFFSALDASRKINDFIFFNTLHLYYGKPALGRRHVITKRGKKLKFKNEFKHVNLQRKEISFLKKKLAIVVAEHNSVYLAHLQTYLEEEVSWKVWPIQNNELEKIKQKRKKLVAEHLSWIKVYAPESGSMKGYLGIDLDQSKGLKDKMKLFLTFLVK